MLAQSRRLDETDLVDIAKTKGQAHLFAISGRDGIGEAVTDVLVRRGDPEVVRNVADNRSAKLSDGGFTALVKRAEGRRRAGREGRPARGHSAASVPRAAGARDRGGAAAPARGGEAGNPGRDPARARQGFARNSTRRRAITPRRSARCWSCIRLASSARPSSSIRQGQEIRGDGGVAVGAVQCADRGRRSPDERRSSRSDPDPLQGGRLRLDRPRGRSSGRVRAPRARRAHSLDAAYANFEKLAPSTAQRVVRFWQVREPVNAA